MMEKIRCVGQDLIPYTALFLCELSNNVNTTSLSSQTRYVGAERLQDREVSHALYSITFFFPLRPDLYQADW